MLISLPVPLMAEPPALRGQLTRARRVLWLGLVILLLAHGLPLLLPGNPHYDEPQVKHLVEVWKTSGVLFYQMLTGRAHATGRGDWFGMGIGVSLMLFSLIAVASPMLARTFGYNLLIRRIVTASCLASLLVFCTVTLLLWLTPHYYRGYVAGLAGLCVSAMVTLTGLLSLPNLRSSDGMGRE